MIKMRGKELLVVILYPRRSQISIHLQIWQKVYYLLHVNLLWNITAVKRERNSAIYYMVYDIACGNIIV